MTIPVNLGSIKSLFDFAFFRDFHGAVANLKTMAETEFWGEPKPSKNDPTKKINNPVLVNYLNRTFLKLLAEYKSQTDDTEKDRILCQRDNKLVFRTGLFTETSLPIYAVFYKATKQTDRSPYTFHRFCDESDGILVEMTPLPRQANYFMNSADLFFDASLDFRYNSNHILKDNIDRFPESIRASGMALTTLSGAIELAKKKVISNYRLAVPTYFEDRISLLFPLYLTSVKTPDLALAVVKLNNVYIGKTVLSMDMAYNDARLIVKPSDDWLVAPKSVEDIDEPEMQTQMDIHIVNDRSEADT